MIIHYVEYHPDASLVQRHNHLFELTDARFRAGGIGGIRTLGHVIVEWVVTPVILCLGRLRLIHGGVVERW